MSRSRTSTNRRHTKKKGRRVGHWINRQWMKRVLSGSLTSSPSRAAVSSRRSSAIHQAWGAGRSIVSKDDKKEVRGSPRSQRFPLLTIISKVKTCAQGWSSGRSSPRSPREIEKVCTYQFTLSIGQLNVFYLATDSASHSRVHISGHHSALYLYL